MQKAFNQTRKVIRHSERGGMINLIEITVLFDKGNCYDGGLSCTSGTPFLLPTQHTVKLRRNNTN